MPDYIPGNDHEFRDWMANFITVITPHLAELGLTVDDLLPLQGVSTCFTTAVAAFVAAKDEMTAASNGKKTKRTASEGVFRPFVKLLQLNPALSDELRGSLRIPVRSTTMNTVGMSEEKPAMFLEADAGKVFVHFGTTPTNERTNGKPAGVKGCNIYRKKAGEESYQMVAYATSSPYVDRITGTGADYTYVVEYRGTKVDDIGSQSEPTTIAARGEQLSAA